MSERVNPFASLNEASAFAPRQPRAKPMANDAIERIAEENGFPSRQATKAAKEPKRKPHLYRTGRNRQLNVKATDQTVERFYKMAEERRIPSGALLELALSALERAGASN